MKRHSYILIIIFLFATSSCICYKKLKLTGCDHPSGWCNEIRLIAVKSWKYAQLAKNVYKKPFAYDLSSLFIKISEHENKEIDFFATLFQDKITSEYVLVFRGTDSFEDFRTGNNPFKQQQNKFALELYDQLKSQYNFTKCIVAGHSLGGGISINLSLNRENLIAYSFNGSPVFRNRNNIKNERYSIVENGEILKLMRLFGREATQLYTSIGCKKGNPISQHDMKNLADCLTEIASFEDSTAKQSLQIK